MDALSHADQVFASVHRRHPLVALPGYVGSPMDDRATLVIPQAVIDACDPVPVQPECDVNCNAPMSPPAMLDDARAEVDIDDRA